MSARTWAIHRKDYFFRKGGMINLTPYYAASFGRHNVRVNCVSPGGFFNNQPEPFLSRYCERTFLGRMAESSDLGGPVVFLLSDAARYVTGANLPVDGGYTAK
ncbi:MAG: SDR family oxidoreductase [Verrucomicrobiae bacterium]|nr:SDR family oxidoreductase [Verrucomicrobiae bacterium]